MSMVTFNTFMNDPVERIESFNAVISVTPEMMAMGVAPGDPDTAVILIKDIKSMSLPIPYSNLYSIYTDTFIHTHAWNCVSIYI